MFTSLESFKNSKNTISSYSYAGKDVEVWRLPEFEGVLKWPSFWDDQNYRAATSTHLLYIRTDETSKVRRDSVMRYLQEGNSVAVIGSSGSGKSCEMNVILFQLIQKMVASKGDWPSAVFYRYPGVMVRFVHSGANIDVHVEKSDDLRHVRVVTNNAKRKYSNKAVLLLEMRESHEVDPHVSIPTYVTLPPCNAENRVRTMSKGGSAVFLVAPPPNTEQILAMAQSQLDCPRPRIDCSYPHIDLPTVAEVKERVQVMGPLAHYVLGSGSFYLRRKGGGMLHGGGINVNVLIKNLERINHYNIPSDVEKYVTLALEGTDPVYGTAKVKFVFLSDHAAEVVRKEALSDSNFRDLEFLGIKHLIPEHVVWQYFRGKWDRSGTVWEPSNPDFDLNDCDVCIDVGCDEVIKPPKKSQHRSALMKLLPNWDREEGYDGMHLERDVKLLAQGCLYRPHFHHRIALGSAMLVNHDEKKVFLIQLTAKDVPDHRVKLSTLETVMTKLGMLSGEENGDYTLWIIFCTDWSRVQTHGSCFTIPVAMSADIKNEKFPTESSTNLSSDQNVELASVRKQAILNKYIERKFFKHSCISEDGTMDDDAFELSNGEVEKDWQARYMRKDLLQCLTPTEIAIMKRCHVLIVRCEHYPSLVKHELEIADDE